MVGRGLSGYEEHLPCICALGETRGQYTSRISSVISYLILRWGGDFRRKACFVVGSHMTDTPITLNYASVVSRYFVHIALNIEAINGIDILLCDIQNAYLTAEFRENIWTCSGPQCG